MLSHNRISCLSKGAFDGLGLLRILSLQSNLISKLPEVVFSKFVLETQQTLSHVSLGDNPLLCDCGMNWAIKWLRSKFLEPGIARCSDPPERRHQLLLSVQPYAPCPTLNNTNINEDLCNFCSPEKCLNDGHCVVDEENGENFPFQYKCICSPGFYGKHCEHQVDSCFGNPCRNGGKCIVKMGDNKLMYEGRFNCICLRGFAGERCERQINECLNGYRCECPKGWFGNYCEFNLCDSLSQNNNCSKEDNVKSSFLSVSRMERANNDGKRVSKRNFCPFNYADPPKCSRRRAIAIKTTNTFLSLGQWPINNFNNSVINGEISFHFATNQSDGTMFWLGDKNDDSFILLELVRGRLRAAVQLGKGHEPYSQLYSMNIGKLIFSGSLILNRKTILQIVK
ncbi:unnamed protein product [Meloidogyne enterolobii]|uniref:Uncharacterized protein n=1 Tax=Meloidogyne enterolobii TaxID=390850 RepID=A0ACB0ZGF3_MELEN